MKKTFFVFSALSLCLCFGVLFVMVLVNDPLNKIGAVVFAFFGLLHHIFSILKNNTER